MLKTYLKWFLLCAVFASGHGIFAHNPEPASSQEAEITAKNTSGSESGCNPVIPNIYIIEIGPNYATISWDRIAGADSYLVKVYEAGTTNLVQSLSTTDTTATLSLAPGMTYDISVTPVFLNCPEVVVTGWLFDLGPIIIELIVEQSAINESCLQPSLVEKCVMLPYQANSTYIFNAVDAPTNEILGKIYFRWLPDNSFTLGQAPRGLHGEVALLQGLQGESTIWERPPVHEVLKARLLDSRYGNEMYQIRVFLENSFLVNVCFEGGGSNSTGEQPKAASILSRDMNPGNTDSYFVELLVPGGCGENLLPDGTDARAALQAGGVVEEPVITNPFADHIQVRTADTAKTPVRFQLLDLNGRPHLDLRYAPAPEYNLPTDHLPAGFYVLRIEINGISKAYKVIKSR